MQIISICKKKSFELKYFKLIHFNNQATSAIIEYINSANDELNIEEVNQIITILSQKKEELKSVT